MSGPDGERPVLENAPRETLAEALARSAPPLPPPEPKKAPPGTMEVVLSVRDRDLLAGAAIQYCRQDGHQKLKDHDYAQRLKKEIKVEETEEYFAMLRDALEDEVRRWNAAWKRYRAWRDWREGLLEDGKLLEAVPDLDLAAEDLEAKAPTKPPLVKPDYDPKENIGPERPFYLPPKLYAWIQDMLGEIEWPIVASEFVTETCAKFGVLPVEKPQKAPAKRT